MEYSITIVHESPYKLPNAKSGGFTEGRVYGGYTREGKYLRFTSSKNQYAVYKEQQGKGFLEDKSEIVFLYERFDPFTGKTKLSDEEKA